MNTMAIDSRAFGANVRSSPSFGDNVVGFLNQCDPVVVTGPQRGDRWIPCQVIGGDARDVFVSKNVLRDQVSEKREKLMRECVKQWIRFKKGDGKEHRSPFFGFVGEFWQSINIDLDGRDRSTPWSAAFISFCVRKAGYTKFKFSSMHSQYAHQSIRRKLDGVEGPFWGFRINEHKPQLGDMVCKSRGEFHATYESAAKNEFFSSHCDIVIGIRESHVSTIGGNVRQSVSKTNYSINSNGFLKKKDRVYAIMRNNI